MATKNIAFFIVVILCSVVFVVGATEQSESEVTPSSLKYYSGNETIECDCGPHGICVTDSEGNETCYCNNGYHRINGTCEECDCGPHGICVTDSVGIEKCRCDHGYNDNNGTCEECDCGNPGLCYFVKGVKTCFCGLYYAIKDGICTECSCSRERIGNPPVRMRCTFENGEEICDCITGYEQKNTTCVDIDECLNTTICPNDTICVNFPSAYQCFCKDGYTGINNNPEKYGCMDIDECESPITCKKPAMSCVNTIGSYYCKCDPGYSAKDGLIAHGCEKDKDGLGVGYIILIVAVAVVVVAALGFVVKKKCMDPRYRTGI